MAAAPSVTVRPVRVAQVSPYSLSVPGGVQAQVLGLARALREAGHHTTVLAPCDGPPPEAGVLCLGRSVPLATNGSVAPLAPDVPCALRTIAALRDESFDVVHVHEPLAPGPSLTSLFFADAPLVGTFHRSGGSAAYLMFRPLVRQWARRLAVRCAVSPAAEATAHSALGGSYTVLYNGVDVNSFASAAPWPKTGPTVLFIGRHEKRKGLEVLLRSLSGVAKDVTVWVAGAGPQTDELRASYGDDPRVEWLGRISDDERARRLRAADVACFPSTGGESFGIVLLEAMAAGAPVVASDIPGYRNVASPGAEAVMPPPGDADALGAAITSVLDDAELAHRLSDAGRRRADAMSLARLAAQYVEIYQRLQR